MFELLSYYLPSVFPPPPNAAAAPPDPGDQSIDAAMPGRAITPNPRWRLLVENLLLGLLILGWYIFSALANNLNKDILNRQIFPFAMLLTLAQFGTKSLSLWVRLLTVPGFNALFSWILVKKIGFTEWVPIPLDRFLKKVVPLSIGHISSNWTTYVALKYVPLSFLHTVKATSPIFTAVLSYIYLQETIDAPIILSMALITFGVLLSSSGELAFNSFGFTMALVSTCIFCCQNVYSKKLFRDKELGYVMLLYYTSLASFCIMLPWWLLTEAPQLTYVGSYSHLLLLYLLTGFCHWMQNILAFAVLAAVSPLTYAIANTVKRIFVIVASILYFHNVVSFLNGTGICLVLGGVTLYNKTKYDKAQSHKRHGGQDLKSSDLDLPVLRQEDSRKETNV